jgi:hypothetical protein
VLRLPAGEPLPGRYVDAVLGTVEFVANSSDLVAVMAELHAALRPGDLAQTLRRVTDAAVELLPDVGGATITVEHEDGPFETVAATGSVAAGPEQAGGVRAAASELGADTAVRLDRLQQTLDEGPAVDVTDSSGRIDPFLGRHRRSQGRRSRWHSGPRRAACSRADRGAA